MQFIGKEVEFFGKKLTDDLNYPLRNYYFVFATRKILRDLPRCFFTLHLPVLPLFL